MFRELWRKKAIIVFLAALLILAPAASVKPAQALSKTVFLSVGIEKSAEGYTVIGATVAYKFSDKGGAETKVVSAEGATVSEALDNITANQGHEASLAYCNLIVLGASLAGENTAELMDYFLRKFEVSNNALLVWTDADVKMLMEKSAAEDDVLETIAAHNQEKVFKKPMTLDKFSKNYRKGREGYMSAVTLKDDEISNTRQAAVFSNGMFVEIKKL